MDLTETKFVSLTSKKGQRPYQTLKLNKKSCHQKTDINKRLT